MSNSCDLLFIIQNAFGATKICSMGCKQVKEAESSASTDWIHEGMTTKFGSASKEQKLPRAASSCAIG
jgi:hypothetical protein